MLENVSQKTDYHLKKKFQIFEILLFNLCFQFLKVTRIFNKHIFQ